jgi:hypothetical protein
MPLWALKRGVILPVTGVSSVTTASHIVQAGSYALTTISADEAAGQTSLSITSGANISNSDQVGIELDDGSMHWTTVSSGGGSSIIVIVDPLASAASETNNVFAYTASSDRIARPLRVIEANVLDVISNASNEIDIEERADYYAMSNRTTEGHPNLIYYDAGLGDNTADPTSATTWYSTFYIWPRFLGGDSVIEFTYQRPFQDFDAASDNPDFPQEFYLAIVLELAALLGPKYGVEITERARLFTEAKMYRDEALSTVAPEGSLQIIPG